MDAYDDDDAPDRLLTEDERQTIATYLNIDVDTVRRFFIEMRLAGQFGGRS